jgi:hypothetical protein
MSSATRIGYLFSGRELSYLFSGRVSHRGYKG